MKVRYGFDIMDLPTVRLISCWIQTRFHSPSQSTFLFQVRITDQLSGRFRSIIWPRALMWNASPSALQVKHLSRDKSLSCRPVMFHPFSIPSYFLRFASKCSHRSHQLEKAGGAFAVAGELPVDAWIAICGRNSRKLDLYARPIGTEFFSQDCGQRSHDALAHL
jgi:hypothetical protein